MDRPGYFIEPTIVRDIKEGSRLVDEEQFGPVLPVIKYSDNDDVIRPDGAPGIYGVVHFRHLAIGVADGRVVGMDRSE